jgi:hypothetical protein
MDVSAQIRKLARSNYWQEVYHASKTCSGIRLFENQDNISGLQFLMLYWLRVYDMLYKELAEKEWSNLDEKVIETDWRCDCFLYWRSKEIEKKIKQYKNDQKKAESKKMKIYQGPKGNK